MGTSEYTMTRKLTKNNKTYYICTECNFAYKDKSIATKCEEWCKNIIAAIQKSQSMQLFFRIV